MKITYQLEEEDYLTYQLFAATQSEIVKKNRLKNRITMPAMYLIAGLIFLFFDGPDVLLFCLALAILWYFLFPFWERYIFVKNCRMAVKANYGSRLDKVVTFQWDEENIMIHDGVSETKFPLKEVEEINEIPTLILVKLKVGSSWILPKRRIADIENIRISLQELTKKLQISYNDKSDWTWR